MRRIKGVIVLVKEIFAYGHVEYKQIKELQAKIKEDLASIDAYQKEAKKHIDTELPGAVRSARNNLKDMMDEAKEMETKMRAKMKDPSSLSKEQIDEMVGEFLKSAEPGRKQGPKKD
jgi:hypothetical protein